LAALIYISFGIYFKKTQQSSLVIRNSYAYIRIAVFLWRIICTTTTGSRRICFANPTRQIKISTRKLIGILICLAGASGGATEVKKLEKQSPQPIQKA